MKLLFFLICTSLSVFADTDLTHAPPSFSADGKKAVFVDFKRAEYKITYDAENGYAKSVSTIEFYMPEAGYPIFDSVTKPTQITLNKKLTSEKLISTPDKASVVRRIETPLERGLHTMMIWTPLENGTRFNLRRKKWGHVSSGFFIRDLTDRKFLEQYVPSNYEYDTYQMEFDVKVIGTKRWHSFFANGEITKINENHYRVTMPQWYRSSSVYLHLVPINRFVRWYLDYPSIDGRKIPVTIYSNYNFYNRYVKTKAWATLKELEADYGPYPHDQLIIYGTGLRGGMEHAGATETSIVSLGHELQHMYFAKNIHPVNGNSGWLDEAIASWRDKGHQTYQKPFYESVNLANHGAYTRKTDKRSYEYGRSFMAYLDHLLKESGKPGLKDFLRHYFQKRQRTGVTTEDFKSDLEDYANMSFGEDFHQYIYGGKEENSHLKHNHQKSFENPHHPQLTDEEFESLI